MSKKTASKPLEVKHPATADTRGYANIVIEYNDGERMKVRIPYRSKVKEIFTLFPPESHIDWYTHSLQIKDTILWYDDEIFKYKDLIKRKAVVHVIEDEEEPFISIIAYYIGVFLEKIFSKCFSPAEIQAEKTD